MAGWFDGLVSKAKSIAGKVVGAVSSVVNNPLVAQVAGMACPGVYNAVKMGVGIANKGLTAVGMTTSGGASLKAAASVAKVTVPVTATRPAIDKAATAAPAVSASAGSTLGKYKLNTEAIASAFKKG